MSEESRHPARRRLLGALLILAIGLGLAAASAVTAPPVTESDDDVREAQRSKKHERDLEIVGGKAAALTSAWDDWLFDRWQDRSLSCAIALSSLASAGLYGFRKRRPPG